MERCLAPPQLSETSYRGKPPARENDWKGFIKPSKPQFKSRPPSADADEEDSSSQLKRQNQSLMRNKKISKARMAQQAQLELGFLDEDFSSQDQTNSHDTENTTLKRAHAITRDDEDVLLSF